MDPEDVKKGLARSGKTQHGLAKALGVDDAAITRMLQGKREIKARELPTIRNYLEMPEEKHGRLGASGAWARDVPVLGTTVGGSAGDFTLNTGDVVDYARRPPTLARSSKVFVLYVQGSSMSRWRDAGSMVYVDPARPPKPGERVVIECHPDRDGEPAPAYLKELVSRTATKLKLKQYNPEHTFDLALSKVKKVHRVIEWEELLAV
jgi:phage repressor protein C with HTH and peptisase S24 domain